MGIIKINLLIGCYTFIVFIFSNCQDNPVIPKTTVKLSLLESSCTEMWFNISMENVPLPVNINLVCDSPKFSSNYTLNSLDTILYVKDFRPGISFRYHVQTPLGIRSNYISAATLDTTTHEIFWQKYEFGDPGEISELRDVFVFNDSKIYAAGSIYLNDSTGVISHQPHGLLIWSDGQIKLLRLETKFYNDPNIFSLATKALVAFSEKDVWFVARGIHYWNGDSVKSYWVHRYGGLPNPIFEIGQDLLSIWGTSNSNLYVSGMKGALARFDGNQWNKLITNTENYFSDIYGVYNYKTNSYDVYCPLVDYFQPFTGSLMIINDSNSLQHHHFNLGQIFGVWGNNNYNVYACGTGVYLQKNFNSWQDLGFDNEFTKLKIRGSDLNNIFVVGGYGIVGHFNGMTWRKYPELQLEKGNYYSVYAKDNTVAICGFNDNSGVLVVGRVVN